AVQPTTPGWLEEDGSNLASVIATTSENSPVSIQRVQDYLSLITPEIQSFTPIRYGDYETVRFSLQGASPPERVEFDAASLSDGTLAALGPRLAAFQVFLPSGPPSGIGIEEPEPSLPPAASRALVSPLDAATEHTQVLLTAHSGDLLDDRKISPASILVVRQR